jgi:hypothetical protein
MKQQHLLYYLSSLNSKMSYSYNDPYVVKCENCPDFSKFKEGMQSF